MTENNNTYQFIKKLAEREGVSEEKIKEIIIDSFRVSYCQGEKIGAELRFEFDSGLSVWRLYKIVEKVKEPEKEITKEDKLIKEGKIKDGIFLLPLNIKNLSFSLNQEIKNRLRNDVKGISWKRQYNSYKSLEGQLVTGSIQNIQDNHYLVNLKGVIGYWDKKELISPVKPRLGQILTFLVKEVREKAEKNVPQVVLTRYEDLFLTKLLEQEIPEIKEKTIVIHGILRLPGLVSKVIVKSEKWGVDPLGTCIGKEAVRIKTLSSLIRPERIDLVAWTENKNQLLLNLLSPVKALRSTLKKTGEWEIVIPQQKVSLLLQHEGIILKKISEYLEVNIHIVTLEEIEKSGALTNKGQILQEVGGYKNIEVQIVEEIEK